MLFPWTDESALRLRAFCRAHTESGLFKSGTQTTKDSGAAGIPFVSATQVCGRPADPRSAFSTFACPLGLHWRLAIRFERQQPAAAGAEHTACCATAASEHSASVDSAAATGRAISVPPCQPSTPRGCCRATPPIARTAISIQPPVHTVRCVSRGSGRAAVCRVQTLTSWSCTYRSALSNQLSNTSG